MLMTALLTRPVMAAGQVEAFRFDSIRVPVGRLFEYVKTNRDGSHPGNISLYVAAAARIESLKWSPGDTTAVLVVGLLDWNRFSARRLESWLLRRGRPPELRIRLDADANDEGLRLSIQPDSLIG